MNELNYTTITYNAISALLVVIGMLSIVKMQALKKALSDTPDFYTLKLGYQFICAVTILAILLDNYSHDIYGIYLEDILRFVSALILFSVPHIVCKRYD